jgi:hypothetical protein
VTIERTRLPDDPRNPAGWPLSGALIAWFNQWADKLGVPDEARLIILRAQCSAPNLPVIHAMVGILDQAKKNTEANVADPDVHDLATVYRDLGLAVK